MRTQFGNNNAYSTWSDNEWNWFRWGEWRNVTASERYRMRDFVRELGQFRAARIDRLNPKTYGEYQFAWKTAQNNDMSGENWSSQRHIMLHHYADSTTPELLILINMEAGTVDFTLPEGRNWGRLIDTQAYFDAPTNGDEMEGIFTNDPTLDPYESWNITLDDPETVGQSYGVQPFSIVVLEEQ